MIVFILPDLKGGGAQRVVINLVIGLKSMGANVEIIVFNKIGELTSYIPENIIIHNLSSKSLSKSIFPLIKKIKLIKPQIVFSTFGYINIGLLLCRLFIPRSVKIWIREANLPSISLPNNSYTFLISNGYKLLYPYADKLFCTSQRMTDEFHKDFKLSISNMQILPNPVNDKMIQLNIEDFTNYDNNKVNFISMGRLTYQKGFDRLLLWLSNMESKEFILRIIGNGPMEQELKDLVKKLNLSRQVIFLGYMDNPWSLIAASDAFLLPSRWEGMPNAALESLVCGTPVIATSESGGIKELNKSLKQGAVIVTSSEYEFCEEMKKIKYKNNKDNKTCLLPQKYCLDNVLEVFNDQLKAEISE